MTRRSLAARRRGTGGGSTKPKYMYEPARKKRGTIRSAFAAMLVLALSAWSFLLLHWTMQGSDARLFASDLFHDLPSFLTSTEKPRIRARQGKDIDSLEHKVMADNAALYFGLHGKETPIGRSEDILWRLSKEQLSLLDDSGPIKRNREIERCERYGFKYDGRTSRRRIFWGSLLADETFHLLQASATEGRSLFHTASFVESNTTGARFSRPWRFSPGSLELNTLRAIFGAETSVTVDYYIDAPVLPSDPSEIPLSKRREMNLHREHLQRQAVLERWKREGMQTDDIGFFGDTDEMFTRDFLRALQICDVPEFQPGQDCHKPKILATGLIFEASPECVIKGDKLWHPDVLIGECIDLIGDYNLHPKPKRAWNGEHSHRTAGYGLDGSYDAYFAANPTAAGGNGERLMYPLWNAADIRKVGGGRQIAGIRTQNAFHMHNFFAGGREIRKKYLTYAELRASREPKTCHFH